MTNRRWSPGKGWLRVLDTGTVAAWMRPEDDGVSIAVYGHDYFDSDTRIYVARVPRGSYLPWEVVDKPHRIRWGVNSNDPLWRATEFSWWLTAPPQRRHRRTPSRRWIWNGDLPPKIRRALEVPRGQEVGYVDRLFRLMEDKGVVLP